MFREPSNSSNGEAIVRISSSKDKRRNNYSNWFNETNLNQEDGRAARSEGSDAKEFRSKSDVISNRLNIGSILQAKGFLRDVMPIFGLKDKFWVVL